MKKLNLFAVTLMLALVPFLQSCLDDNDANYSDFTIATLKQINDGDDYYFGLDSGRKMYPGDDSAIRHFPIKDGKRVFVWFHQLEEQVPDYDYNIQVVAIDSILTKDIIPLTVETADSIGDDRINMLNYRVAQGYLTMEFQYYGTRNPNKKHMLNLVYDVDKELVDEEGYINLEFRHNAFDDNSGIPGEGIVSFKLDKVATEMETAKGLKIRTNSLYDNVVYKKIDLKKTSENNRASADDKQLKPMNYTTGTNY